MICSSLTPSLEVSTIRLAAMVAGDAPRRHPSGAGEPGHPRGLPRAARHPHEDGSQGGGQRDPGADVGAGLLAGAEHREELLRVVDGAHVQVPLEDLVEGPIERGRHRRGEAVHHRAEARKAAPPGLEIAVGRQVQAVHTGSHTRCSGAPTRGVTGAMLGRWPGWSWMDGCWPRPRWCPDAETAAGACSAGTAMTGR